MQGDRRKNRAVQPTVLEWSRYLVLDQCLRDRNRYYYLEDLVEAVNKMLRRYDFYEVSQRTVQEDLKFMQSGEGFGAVLAKRYDGHTKIYTYEDPHFSIMNLPMTDRESDLLSATITMLSRFRGMPNYRWLENTLRVLRTKFNVGAKTASVAMSQNNGLKGLDDWFEPLFEACRKRLIVTLLYNRFDRLDKEPSSRVIEPYQMREHNNRWYLVGREGAKEPRLAMVVVPIDRILELKVESVEERDKREAEGRRFAVPNDDKTDAYFKDVIGLSRNPESTPETVRVKAWGLTAHYMDTKPLHPSQSVEDSGIMMHPVTGKETEYKVFEWNVIPNEPLIQQFLVYGNEAEVIEPLSLRQKVAQRARDILRNNDNPNATDKAEKR